MPCNCSNCRQRNDRIFWSIVAGQFDNPPQVVLDQFLVIDTCVEQGIDPQTYAKAFDWDIDAIDGIIDRMKPYNMEDDGA